MQDNLNNIFVNTLNINKDNLNKDTIKNIIESIKKSLDINQDLIIEANNIDLKNNNGFTIDNSVIERIFNNIEKENIYYKDVTISEKKDNVIYGKELLDIGNIVLISDGNTYTILEMILRNIIAGNTIIISDNGYMYGTNELIIQLIQTVLEEYNISKYLVQLYYSEDYEDILSNHANIDLVICIGDHSLQKNILKKSNNKILVSGYNYFDLYIEDDTYMEFINKIISSGISINVYAKEGIDIDDAIIVNDIDEAIAQINYNGNSYSSSIFTSSDINASKFIKEVKSKIVTVNTSPSIERILDIKQKDLMNEKTIIYPSNIEIKKED